MKARKSKSLRIVWEDSQSVFEAAARANVVVKVAPFDGKGWVKELLARPAGERTEVAT